MAEPATPRLYGAAEKIEDLELLDGLAAVAEPLVEGVLRSGSLRPALAGRWLGHSLHPMLTDFPLGSWMSASLLDLIGGRGARVASRRLLAFGLAAAVPTMAAGWTDWLSASRREKRVGVVHAAVNVTASLFYLASYLARRCQRHGVGVALGLTGGVAATAGGFLGGHLSLARDTGRRATTAALGGGEEGGNGRLGG